MALTEETIEDIEGFEGRYAISSSGRVWSYPKGTNSKEGCWMKPDMSRNGYPSVSLMVKGSKVRFLVHRLVAEKFIQKSDESLQVNHINGDKTDCRVENLEWVTASQNRQHAWETGLQKASELHKETARKAGYSRRLFTMSQAKRIRLIYESKWMSQYELADMYGTSQAVINGIVKYKTYVEEAA